ncbi:MAG TPA: helix-turn-helix transcriptional regulator [Verrucomicrobiae bacterium]|nr:helix-turn-helix transcriptional regulator [Verrucomicrobiae bacterium]
MMNRDEFARNLAAGTYDLIVLDVLRDGPSYGYGIVKRIYEQSKHTIRWHEGTVYPVLHHLEEQGLVTSEWKEPKRGRQRRYYRLTARGQCLWREQRAQWRAFCRGVNSLLGL